MNDIIEKIELVKNEILNEKRGIFYFFGLLERTDSIGKWDIVISANWLEQSNSEKDLVYVIDKLKSKFENNLEFLSRIVLFTSDEDFINDLGFALTKKEKIKIEACEEVNKLVISDGVAIRHMFVITSDFSALKLHEPAKTISRKDLKTEKVSSF